MNELDLNIDSWPTPDEGALEESLRSQYLLRKLGVKLYLNGASAQIIKKEAGIGLSQVYRLIHERCLQIHEDGRIYGWRALVPNLRISDYKRKRKVSVDNFGRGAVGAFAAVLNQHPNLREKFEKRILESAPINKLAETNKSRRNHWRWFIKQLSELGYEIKNEWPFNTENCGYVSVCRHIDEVLAQNPNAAARVTGGVDNQKKLLTGDGTNRPVEHLFQRVEMDAHKLDGRFCVMVPQVTGGWTPKIVHRIWVIVIIEVVSRAVLGYHLSMGKEVSKEDVLRTIKKSLTRWNRSPISFSDEVFKADANLPSGVSEKYVGICWDETSVDGALAETCAHVKRVLKDVVNSELIEPKTGFSKRRGKDDRPFIEAFFRKIGVNGFQRLTNTTGSNPKGKHGRDPEQIAITSQFQLEYAQELLDVIVANYNATGHSSLGGRSPLSYLAFRAMNPERPLRYADPNSVNDIVSYRKTCIVKGGYKEGRRPYVNFGDGRYTNNVLGQRHDLVGQKIWVINHLEDDARVAQASTLDGQPLGILQVGPPWNRLPHSLAVRRAIMSLVRRQKLKIAIGADAVESFIASVEKRPDKKLPIHPAYLEARRILVRGAESLMGQSMLELARERISDEASPTKKIGDTSESVIKPTESRKLKLRQLPPPRKAANN